MRGQPDCKRADAQAEAEKSVQEAHAQVASVRDQIQSEICALKKTQTMLRSELHHQVNTQAPKLTIMSLTKKLKKIEQSISEKDRLHSNIERERTQLQDTSTNTSVASAMMRSVEAQRSLQKLDLGDHIDLDDMLDDIEENRHDTRTLANRLANLGGDDIQNSCSDEDEFDANDVFIAMGISACSQDTLLSHEISDQLNRAKATNNLHFSDDGFCEPKNETDTRVHGVFPSVPDSRRPQKNPNRFFLNL
jgi:hypothetical protein